MTTNNPVNSPLSGTTGTGNFVGANTPTLITPALGAATATSVNFGGSTLSTYTQSTAWTPVFTFTTPGNLSVSYAAQIGLYSRIGNIVVATFTLTCTPTHTSASGLINITGLPFAATASGNFYGNASFGGSNTLPAGTACLTSTIDAATQVVRILASISAGASTNLTTTNAATTVQILLQGTVTYLV